LRQFTILHTIETGGPGGAETVFLELASNLDRARFRSIALLPPGSWLPQQLEDRKIPAVIARSKVWYDLHLPKVMSHLVKKEKVDLIHAHLPDQNFYSCLVGRWTGCKVVVTYHGAPQPPASAGMRGAIKSWVVRRNASAIVVVSDYLRQMFADSGYPAAVMTRIYNGINMGSYSSRSNAPLRKELGLAEDAKLVGMVANLRRPKGYEYFVRAARQITDRIPETRFISVGEKDTVIAGELTDLIHQLGLEGKFFFLGFRSDIPAILKGLDVFVLSSTDEGLSIATIEAMAAGRPVVVTRSGGPEEIVKDGQTGFLVPPANAEALAERVCDVLGDPQLASSLGESAREDVHKRFDLSNMIREYESLYLRCLGVH